jgi:hypothetical protein
MGEVHYNRYVSSKFKGEVERSREVVDGICMVVQKKAKVREVEKL